MFDKIYNATEIDPENLRDIADKIVNDHHKAFDFYDKLRSILCQPHPSQRGGVGGENPDSLELRDFLFLLPDFFMLLIRLFTDQRVAKHKKIFLSCLIGYICLPFDLIPDFIPLAGYLDDFTIVVLGLDVIFTDIDNKIIYENWSGKQNVVELIRSIVIKFEESFYKPIFRNIKKLLNLFGEPNERNNHSHQKPA